MSSQGRATIAEELRAGVEGSVVTPEDDGYPDAVTGFNLAVVHRPEVVVGARSVEDVALTLRVAARTGHEVVAMSAGHGQLSAMRSGLLLDLRRLDAVVVDPVTATAVVSGGATWQDVLDAATPFGLAPVCGAAPSVGVVGFLLGGGLGPISRTVGFGSDHVVSFDVVTTDGSTITASGSAQRDLFWALRGGGHGLGVVVTAVTIRLLRRHELYGGSECYPASTVPTLLEAFRRVTAEDLVDTLTLSVAVVRLPAQPTIPAQLRNQTVGQLRVGYLSPTDPVGREAERLLSPLRAVLPAPITGWVGRLPYGDIGAVHDDPTVPTAQVTAGVLLDRLDETALQALLAVAGPAVPTGPRLVEIRHLGGALAAGDRDDAVSGRDAAYGVWLSTDLTSSYPDRAAQTITQAQEALLPWAHPYQQANFIGTSPCRPVACWPPVIAERLSSVRRRYRAGSSFPGS